MIKTFRMVQNDEAMYTFVFYKIIDPTLNLQIIIEQEKYAFLVDSSIND